jgi:O-antigen/teichoic acid export membrane protein
VTSEPIAATPVAIGGRASHTERQSSSWDIKNAPRNYISLVAFQVGSAVFAFTSVWLITRYLGSEGYGAIVAVIAASQVAQIFVNWTSVAVVRYGVDEFVDSAGIARTFWTRLSILFVNLVLVVLLSAFWFPPLADWLKMSPGAFWLVLAHFCVTAFWLHIQVSLQGAKLLRLQSLLQMLERLSILIGILGLVAFYRVEFYWVVICYIAAPAAMIVIGSAQLRSLIGTRFSFDGQFVKKILLFSLPLLPFTLVGYFSGSYVDAVFISKFLSIRDLGIYSIATQVNGIALQMPLLANTILLPLFVTLMAESDRQRSFNYFRNILPGLTLLWGIACAALSFVGYLIIPTVFGAEFSGASLPLWILLTASVVSFPVAVGYSALSNAASTTWIPMIATIISATVNILGNIFLIPKYGMAGCAWATLLAFFTSAVVFAILLKSTAQMPVSWTFLAVIPSVLGVLSFIFFNSWIALLVCVGSSVLLGLLRWTSMNEMLRFVLNFRRSSREPG